MKDDEIINAMCDFFSWFNKTYPAPSNNDNHPWNKAGIAFNFIRNRNDKNFLLAGERKHINSIDCWCKPYQDDICPNVWIHNETPTGNA